MGTNSYKLVSEEDFPKDKQCYYYSILCSRDLKPIQLLNEICSKLFLGNQKINFQELEEISIASVEKKFHLILKKTDPSIYQLIYFKISNESIKEKLESIISKIKYITFGWMAPDDLGKFENYSSDYDIIKLYTSYDPYYLLKRSKIQPEFQNWYQDRWYKPRAIEVNIKTSKIDAHDVLSSLLQKKITETIKLSFNAKFSNPGEASITVDRDARVTHERGELQATEKIVSDVVQKTQEKLTEYSQYSTFREYTKLPDGSFDLSDYSPTQPFYYSFEFPENINEFSVKLENLLTISKKSLQIYGTRLQRMGRDFSCLTYIPVDRSELRLTFCEDDGIPQLIVDPLHTTPIGILTFTRILSEKMTWSTKLCGFYD
jgi:hypothetical protein